MDYVEHLEVWTYGHNTVTIGINLKKDVLYTILDIEIDTKTKKTCDTLDLPVGIYYANDNERTTIFMMQHVRDDDVFDLHLHLRLFLHKIWCQKLNFHQIAE